MKRLRIRVALTAAAVAVGALSACTGADNSASTASNPDAAPATTHTREAYLQIAALPDWSGVWEPVSMGRPSAAPPPPEPPRLTPAYAAQYAAFQEKNRTTPGINFISNVANCVPPGLPASMLQPYPIEFLFTPGRVTILIETYQLVRRIYTDGSPLPENPDPTYQGTSVGRWEGDTLVVETIGILPETSPLSGINGHSEKLRITERMRLIEPDLLEIVTTREDPEVFLEPYTTTARYVRHRDWKIMEYVCAQNNRDSVDEHGNPGINIERNPGE
jgi:hypothetical protein